MRTSKNYSAMLIHLLNTLDFFYMMEWEESSIDKSKLFFYFVFLLINNTYLLDLGAYGNTYKTIQLETF